MEEVFRCKIDRRLKKEEVRSDRSAEWRTDTPQLQQLSRSSVLVWPVPRASLKTLPEPSSGPTLRSVDLLIRFKRHWEQHMAHKCSLPPRANCWWCARALRWGGRMPRHAKKSQNKQRIHPRLPRASTTSHFTRKATVPLFTRLRTCATTSGVNFADSHRFNLTHKHLDEPQTAQLDPKTKAECSSYLLMWCEATAAGDLLWCREPVTKNHQSAKTYKTSCSVPVKIKSAQAGRWAFFHVFPTWWHKATMVVLLKNKYI